MDMRGTIVINAEAGRALRTGGAALLTLHILDCPGSLVLATRSMWWYAARMADRTSSQRE